MRSYALGALRSPIVWLVGAVAALFLAPAATSAQEIDVITADNNSRTAVLIGDPGGRFQEYWFRQGPGGATPGAWIRGRVTPEASRQYELTQNKRLRAPIRGEAWSSRGLEDTGSFSRSTSSSCVFLGTFRTERDCWSFRAGSADVLNPHAGLILWKVANHAPTAIQYTTDLRGLDTNTAVSGTPAGATAPTVPQRRAALTGSLVGTTAGASHYYSFFHPGGGDASLGGEDIDVLVRIEPNLVGANRNNVRVNVYRGTQLVGSAVGGSPLTPVEDPTGQRTQGGAADFEVEVRSTTPGWYAVEIWNGNAGQTIWYAASID